MRDVRSRTYRRVIFLHEPRSDQTHRDRGFTDSSLSKNMDFNCVTVSCHDLPVRVPVVVAVLGHKIVNYMQFQVVPNLIGFMRVSAQAVTKNPQVSLHATGTAVSSNG